MQQVYCKRCKKLTNKDDIHYVSSEMFYCQQCFEDVQAKPKKVDAKEYDVTPSAKDQFTCAKCGFTSSFSSQKVPKICDYCGSSLIEQKTATSAQLLAEADSETHRLK